MSAEVPLRAMTLNHLDFRVGSKSICPACIDLHVVWTMIDDAVDTDAMQSFIDAPQPGGRTGEPSSVSWGCVGLVSDEARFVTKADFVIDGKLLAR